jgi:hypothetical protein
MTEWRRDSCSCRVVDTRNSDGPLGGPGLKARQARDFPVQSACGIPATAQAYAVNATVAPAVTLGYLSLWPSDQPQPVVYTLNDLTGTVVANAAILAGAAGTGDITAYATDDSDLVLDVSGYFAPAGQGGLSLYIVTPCRMADTRFWLGFTGQNYIGYPCTAMPNPPYTVVINATAIPRGPLGYLTLWPIDQPQPLVSTLNALDGAITSNMAIVQVPYTNGGNIDAYATDWTDLVLDLTAYFAP